MLLPGAVSVNEIRRNSLEFQFLKCHLSQMFRDLLEILALNQIRLQRRSPTGPKRAEPQQQYCVHTAIGPTG
jgi:hypothetical protein